MLKNNWETVASEIPFDVCQRIVDEIYEAYTSFHLLPQGHANLHIGVLSDEYGHEVVRVYLGKTNNVAVERAAMDLVGDIVPVARVRQQVCVSGYDCLVMERVQGISLRDLLLKENLDIDLYQLMQKVGAVLGRFSEFGFMKQSGLLNEALQVTEVIDYAKWGHTLLMQLEKSGKLALSRCQLWQDILQKWMPSLESSTSDRLVHGDFDPSNVFVEMINGQWEVSAVLDWEFVHAGSPLQDIANMLRYRNNLPDTYTQGLIKGVQTAMVLPVHWEVLIDLYNGMSLLDCLNRTDMNTQPCRGEDIDSLLKTLEGKLSDTSVSSILAPVSKNIKVVAYDEQWPIYFEEEASLIRKALGVNLLSIEHVGSTSIPGMVAKPKIDMVMEAADMRSLIDQMSQCGYLYRGQWNVPGKYGFTKRGKVSVNLHAYPKGHPEIACNLLFRDTLRESPELCQEYGVIKKQLLNDLSSFERQSEALGFPKYTLVKGTFVQSVLRDHGFIAERLLLPTTRDELQYVKECMPVGQETCILCYRGVEIVGFVIMAEDVKIHLHEECEHLQVVYEGLINQWLDNAYNK